jgi:RNA polymerase sigma-70 factor (ECF subfamily)
MAGDAGDLAELLEQAAAGDETALVQLFSRYSKRLKKMVRLRLNRLLQGRIDDSDIVQEAYLEAAKRLPEYLAKRLLPFFLWLRHVTGEKMIEAHRRHLGAKMRDAAQEVSLHRGPMPAASSVSLAAQLLGRLTSPSQAAIKAETRLRVQQVLNSMDPLDREVLALRHFEQLSNAEVAETLGINESTASSRYLRALKRLKDELSLCPGVWQLNPPQENSGHTQRAMGIVEYRRGNYAQALDWCQKSLSGMNEAGNPSWLTCCHGTALLFSAMAAHQLGQTEDARRWLAEARRLIGTVPLPDNTDWLMMDLVRREAEALVEGKQADPRK